MAYTIPVVALVLDHQAAAAALNNPTKYPSDFFDDERQDRWDAVEKLAKITNAPIQQFSSEDGSIFYVGIEVYSDFCIAIDATLASKAAAERNRYSHPLVQNATLAVVSQFC